MKYVRCILVLSFIVVLLTYPVEESHTQVSAAGMIAQKFLQDMIQSLVQVELIKNMSQFELDDKINEAHSNAKEAIDRYYENQIRKLEEGFQKRQAKRKSDGTPEGIKTRNEENDRDFLELTNDRDNVRLEWEAALEALEIQVIEFRQACWEIRKDQKIITY